VLKFYTITNCRLVVDPCRQSFLTKRKITKGSYNHPQQLCRQGQQAEAQNNNQQQGAQPKASDNTRDGK
jgi:hypothetical protein